MIEFVLDPLRIGRSLRAIRMQRDWRQSDLAERAGVSRSLVSKIERGALRHGDLERLERICATLGADLDVRIRWRGEGLDRLLDQAHAVLVDRVVELLGAARWEVAVEATFSVFGERGSIDVFAWHPSTATLLVIEVKSVVADAQGTLAPLDRKTRLAPRLARERGWFPRATGRLLVVGDRMASRRRVGALAALFDAALPARGHAVRHWLRVPSGDIAGLLFLSDSPPGGTRRRGLAAQRVNPRRCRRNGLE